MSQFLFLSLFIVMPIFSHAAAPPCGSLLNSPKDSSIEDLKREYKSQIQGGFNQYDDRLGVTKKILDLATEIAEHHGVQVKIENLTTGTGDLKTYPALRIFPSPGSPANTEAQLVHQNYGGLKLYLSPYDLKRSGANAFFNPDGSVIGVPFDFIYGRIPESYLHEKMHATTFLKLIESESDTYAGVFRLIKGEQLSTKNYGGYNRLASLDELLTTLFSAKYNSSELYRISKKSSRSEFLKADKNENLLAEIKFNLDNGIGLSAQTVDLAERALKIISDKSAVTKKTIILGDKLSKEVFVFKVLVDSYERQIPVTVAIPGGSELSFYSLTDDVQKIKARLQEIIQKAEKKGDLAKKASKVIGLRGSMYADLETTNLDELEQACSQL